jgi:hypothetical protein
MSCCPRLPAVNTWDPAKNQKRSIERALRKAQAKEEESNQQNVVVEDNE